MKESFIDQLNSEISAFQIENRRNPKYVFIGKKEGRDLYYEAYLTTNKNADLFYNGAEVLDVEKESFLLLA